MKKITSLFLSLSLVLSLFIPFVYPQGVKARGENVPSSAYLFSSLINSKQYQSSVIKSDIIFTGISTKWSSELSDIDVFLRSGKKKSSLGDWTLVSDEDDKKDSASEFSFGSIFNGDKDRYFQYKVIFEADDLGKTFDIEINVFDTSKETAPSLMRVSADNSGIGPKIVSRTEWGANEKYMTWDPEYSEVKAIVIHHTAGEEGAKASDQMSVVRNLYYGHAVTYGWGDIGYNYVIDSNGTIYEGRSGGGGVVAGHTLGYNNGTIGIVLVGDYNVRAPSVEQYDALASLIAYKSFQYGIEPSGSVYLKNKTISTVIGHRDLNATACPGDALYGRLFDLRGKINEKIATYPQKTVGSQFVSSDSNVQLYGGDITKVNVSLKNTGNTPWYKGTKNGLDITTKNGSKVTSSLEDFGRAIEPGEVGNFILNISSPAINKAINQVFEPRIGGNLISSSSSFNINLNIVTPEYRGRVVGQSADSELIAGKQGTAWVDVKNTGTNSWSSSDGVKIFKKDGSDSKFYTAGDWESAKGAGGLDSPNVGSESTGRISFLITAPDKAGQYSEKFIVRADNRNLEGGEDLEATINLSVTGGLAGELINTVSEPKVYSSSISDYGFSFINQSPYLTLEPSGKGNVWIEVKNTGTSNWYKDTLRLATIGDKESSFADSSWLSKNRISFNQDKVAPGETARFDFTITAPSTSGVTKERFGFVVDGIGWLKDIGIFWNFTVSGAATNPDVNTNTNNTTNSGAQTISSGGDDFQYINQSPYFSMNPGTTQEVWLEVKNTGTTTWQKAGSTPVRLATSMPRDRGSSFIPTNRVNMDSDSVAPGGTARFTFSLTAPATPGVYKEYFTLVRDGVAWMKDIGIYWQITVNQAVSNNNNTSNTTPNTSTSTESSQVTSVPAGIQTVKVSSSGPFIVVNSSEVKLSEGGAGDQIEAYYNKNDGKHYFRINNGQIKEASGWVRIVPWAEQTVLTIDTYEDRPTWNTSLNDNRFKGAIEVRYTPKTNKVWVIDDLNIEDYLKGVSEPMDSEGYEYVKAAVIAERSYIYYHLSRGGRWPDDAITLKNSRNGNGDDQIYQGYNFTTRAKNIPNAVSDTAGLVVSYNGNPVLTPYYTQSDGNTRNISDVWGSRQSDYPWLVSVPDPWSAGYPMLGHGVGMSGRGARGMARDGKKYDEILKYFYTGTSTIKIDTNRNVRVGIYSIAQ